jgi:hypothetical protein
MEDEDDNGRFIFTATHHVRVHLCYTHDLSTIVGCVFCTHNGIV